MYYQKVVNTGLPESIPDSALAVEAQWSVQVAGAKRPATLPDWRSPGQSVSAAKPGAEQPGATHTARRASMARIASTHPLTRRWGQRPQLNKPTSGRQARPPKGGSGGTPGQSFYVHKNISGYFFAGPDRTRCMATYKCALREKRSNLFLL